MKFSIITRNLYQVLKVYDTKEIIIRLKKTLFAKTLQYLPLLKDVYCRKGGFFTNSLLNNFYLIFGEMLFFNMFSVKLPRSVNQIRDN